MVVVVVLDGVVVELVVEELLVEVELVVLEAVACGNGAETPSESAEAVKLFTPGPRLQRALPPPKPTC